MKTTFIVTSYDVLPYVDHCLDTLAQCTRPGDSVVIVDDGSEDGTAEHLARRVGPKLGEADAELIQLGVNTMGGVGIPANFGLSQALADPACETIFFVDGDDWMDPAGFAACRAAFEAGRPEILLANYLEYDELTGDTRHPADHAAWGKVKRQAQNSIEANRGCALEMIAAPWRKFYCANFLRTHRLRFPEGDFFYEDNPFHWSVCLKAERIAFLDRTLSFHRINRAGQTMSATGSDLFAFFVHFDSIKTLIDGWESPHAEAALRWLLTNMTWHLERLDPSACWHYAERAVMALKPVPDALWQRVAARFDDTNSVALQASALRRGEIAATVGCWQQDLRARSTQLEIDGLTAGLRELRDHIHEIDQLAMGLSELKRFKALLALPHPEAPPLPPQGAA